jgi:hypothetical protein
LYKTAMPNQRAPGQKLLAVPMHHEFIAAIEAAVLRKAYSGKSELIREAVYEKLTKIGLSLPKSITYPPSRRGKGGRKNENHALQ